MAIWCGCTNAWAHKHPGHSGSLCVGVRLKVLNLIFIIILARTRANLWSYSKHQQICCGFEPNAEILQHLNEEQCHFISFSFGLSFLFLHWNILFAKAPTPITIFMHNALFCFTVLLCKNTCKMLKTVSGRWISVQKPDDFISLRSICVDFITNFAFTSMSPEC